MTEIDATGGVKLHPSRQLFFCLMAPPCFSHLYFGYLMRACLSVLAVLSLLREMGDWKLEAYELSVRHDGK